MPTVVGFSVPAPVQSPVERKSVNECGRLGLTAKKGRRLPERDEQILVQICVIAVRRIGPRNLPKDGSVVLNPFKENLVLGLCRHFGLKELEPVDVRFLQAPKKHLSL